jgi:hypothetical protein
MVSGRVGTILGGLAVLLSAGVTAVARAEPVPPSPASPFRSALIGDTGYNAEGERNFVRVRDSDNEWQDCPQGPDGRLAAIRQTFFSSGHSLGWSPIPQRRQAGTPEWVKVIVNPGSPGVFTVARMRA